MLAERPNANLLVPGLPGLPSLGPLADELSLPGMARLMARGRMRTQAPLDLNAHLFRRFSVSAPPGGDIPVAPVTAALDGAWTGAGWYLRADPVYLRPDLDKLILFDAETFELGEDDAEALCREVAELFAPLPGELRAPSPKRWYLRLAEDPGIRTVPLEGVRGGDVGRRLPAGDKAMRWHRLINEVQMLLHASEVNRARELRGLVPVNSLWLWGGGHMPRSSDPQWETVWASEPTSLGLAAIAGIPRRALPRNAGDWLRADAQPGEHLLVVTGGLERLRYLDPGGWRAWLLELERDWLAPLITALSRGLIGAVDLDPGSGVCWRLRRSDLRRWWRRPRPISRYLADSARSAGSGHG